MDVHSEAEEAGLQRAKATLAKLAEDAMLECSDSDEPLGTVVPPIVVPTIGHRYFVAIQGRAYSGVIQVLFRARLVGLYQDTDGSDLELRFDNGVTVAGFPDLLPDGWEHRDNECRYTFELITDPPTHAQTRPNTP